MSSHHTPHRGHVPATSAADLPDIQLPAPQPEGGMTGRALHGVGWLAGRVLRGVALGLTLGVTATGRGIFGALRWLAVSVWRMARGLWAVIAHVVGTLLGRKGGKAAGSQDTSGVSGTSGMSGTVPGSDGGRGTGTHDNPTASPGDADRNASPYLSMQPPGTPHPTSRKTPQGPTRPRAPRSGWPLAVRLAQWARQGRGPSYRQNWVSLGNISRNLVLAVTIAEDDKFWQHEGFDLDGMEEAFLRNIEEGRIAAGGSTITQQLAKNLWFTPEKSLSRKAKEAIMAWRLERELSKKRILELYLNVVEWGDGVFGAEAAARHHYGKSAAALTSWEAARLAAVLPNPLRWSPTGTSRGVQVRASIIHSRMERRMGGG